VRDKSIFGMYFKGNIGLVISQKTIKTIINVKVIVSENIIQIRSDYFNLMNF
jgi:hypothetical protein